ncbi:MAG: alpha/beta hydrolase [Gammaproteobacteria bacterium]|nr:alpha/beta hydrolase [Gammaproteobacteria bacterium]MDH3467734.1 alpha/beta hydrolase [Gammaproteobacteria bacterium]
MAFLDLPQLRLHYQSSGRGEAVVLIHGLGANLAFWYLGVARALSRNYQVITYDLRGHGRSGAPRSGYTLEHMTNDLDALLTHLGIERAHLVGHSFGARIALSATIRQPERIASLTVADSQLRALQPPMRLREWPYWQTWKRQLQAQGNKSLPSDEKVIDFHLLSYVSQLAPAASSGEMTGPHYRPSLRKRDMGQRGRSRWMELTTNPARCDELEAEQHITVQQIERLAAPTLAVYGEYSHCLGSCYKLTKLMPNCRMVIVPKAGHFHPATKPRMFSRVLLGFLSGRLAEVGRRRQVNLSAFSGVTLEGEVPGHGTIRGEAPEGVRAGERSLEEAVGGS